MASPTRHAYLTLDGMRGVASIGVVLYHYQGMVFQHGIKAGYLAVDLFFCLSGFVIGHAYEQRLLQGMRLRTFALIRFIRLWPLIALGLMLGVLQSGIAARWTGDALSDPAGLVALLLNLFLLPVLANATGAMFPANPPAWSVFYELMVNLVYAAIVRFLSDRAMLLLMVASAMIVIHGVLSFGNGNFGWAPYQLSHGIGRVGFSFFAGVLLYRRKDRLSGIFQPKPWLLLLLTGVVLALPVTQLMRPAFDSLFILIGSPLLVWLGAQSEPDAKWIPSMMALGVLSYPLYALHYPLYLATLDLVPINPSNGSFVAGVAIAATCGLSVLLASVYDAPIRRRLSRFVEPRISGHFEQDSAS